MALEIKKATRVQRPLKMNIAGVSGGGKTFTALAIATGLGGDILVVDTERKSASLYADMFSFSTIELDEPSPMAFAEAFQLAENGGFKTVILDSLSHAWDWVLAEKERIEKRTGKNSFQSWGDANHYYDQLLNSFLNSPLHVISTMRSKSDYVMEEYEDSKGRKRSKPIKVGLAAKFRPDGEYEFDVYGFMTPENDLVIEKTRIHIPCLTNRIINRPTAKLGEEIRAWYDGSVKSVVEPKPESFAKAKKLINGAIDATANSTQDSGAGSVVGVLAPASPKTGGKATGKPSVSAMAGSDKTPTPGPKLTKREVEQAAKAAATQARTDALLAGDPTEKMIPQASQGTSPQVTVERDPVPPAIPETLKELGAITLPGPTKGPDKDRYFGASIQQFSVEELEYYYKRYREKLDKADGGYVSGAIAKYIELEVERESKKQSDYSNDSVPDFAKLVEQVWADEDEQPTGEEA